MHSKRYVVIGFWSALLSGLVACDALAQQPQIPTLQVCNQTAASGRALVKIESRADAQHAGTFEIALDLKCDPKNPGYPAGTVEIRNLNMSDSTVQGAIVATAIEQLTSTGKATPTLYVNGRCKAEAAPGCRFWLMVASNRRNVDGGTPDVVSFLVFEGTGHRVAYGTGPVIKGDIDVTATPN